jgi:hypothetical protein
MQCKHTGISDLGGTAQHAETQKYQRQMNDLDAVLKDPQ